MSIGVVSDNVRIWLHSVLEKPWCGSHVAYSLNNDVLRLIVEQWSTLDTTIKLRLLTTLLSIKPAQLRNTQEALQKVTALAADDNDGWVQSIGQLMSTAVSPDYPHFNFSALEKNPETSSVLETVKSHCTQSLCFLYLGHKPSS